MQYEQTWYDLTRHGVPVVLSFPTKGHVIGWGMPFDRGYESKVLKASELLGKFVVDVQFDAAIGEGSSVVENPEPLFNITGKARYVWETRTGRFHIDSRGSNISEAQIWAIVNDDADGFLTNNYTELRKLALSKDRGKHMRLARFLQHCKDTPQKRDLFRIIDTRAY